jgi:hypothetical protein
MATAAEKLQLTPDQRLLVLEGPAEAAALLPGVTRATSQDDADALLLFATSQTVVEANAARLRDHLRAGGIAWAAYPRTGSGRVTDVSRDRGWGSLATLGLRPVRQVVLDDTWSALRFRYADDEQGA